jgi:hypothetical protein
MSDHGWQLALIAGLVLVSAVFSGSEMALVSLRDGQLQRLAYASAGGRPLSVLAAICWTASDTSPTQPGEHVTVGRYTADVTAVTVTPSLRSACTPSATTTRTPPNAAANSHRA